MGVGARRSHQRRLGLHVDRLDAGFGGTLSRTTLHAQAASGAVLHIELQAEVDFGIATGIDGSRLERGRRTFQPRLVEVLRADHTMRAYETALAALHAEIGQPRGYFFCDIP